MIHLRWYFNVFLERNPEKKKQSRPNFLPLLPFWGVQVFCYLEFFDKSSEDVEKQKPKKQDCKPQGGSSGRECGCAILYFFVFEVFATFGQKQKKRRENKKYNCGAEGEPQIESFVFCFLESFFPSTKKTQTMWGQG